MINTITKLTLVALIVLLNGCGSGNDSPTALPEVNAFESLQTNVLEAHGNALISALEEAEQPLTGTLSQSDVETLQNNFETIMKEWKSVQNAYVAADFDSALIDIPQLMDFFHTGKSLDIASDVDTALASTVNIEDALFKNSSKSITALEYLVFANGESLSQIVTLMNANNGRRIEAIKVSLAYLKVKAQIIAHFYKNDSKFIADDLDAANSVANVLIDSAFRLKEFRIGEPAGIVAKYADDPDPERLEYLKSELSLVAVKAILLTHQEIMGEQSYENFGSFAIENSAEEVVTNIRVQLKLALGLVAEFSTLEDAISTTAIDPKIQTLYDTIKELQRLYFESLIQALNLTEEIIESDGD